MWSKLITRSQNPVAKLAHLPHCRLQCIANKSITTQGGPQHFNPNCLVTSRNASNFGEEGEILYRPRCKYNSLGVTLSFSFYVVVKFSLSLQLAVDLFVLYSQSFIICEVKTFSKEQLIWYL